MPQACREVQGGFLRSELADHPLPHPQARCEVSQHPNCRPPHHSTHPCAHRHAHAHTLTLTHKHAHTCTHMHTHTHSHTHTHTHTRARVCAHEQTHRHPLDRSCVTAATAAPPPPPIRFLYFCHQRHASLHAVDVLLLLHAHPAPVGRHLLLCVEVSGAVLCMYFNLLHICTIHMYYTPILHILNTSYYSHTCVLHACTLVWEGMHKRGYGYQQPPQYGGTMGRAHTRGVGPTPGVPT